MLLKGQNNQIAINAATPRRITGSANWRPTALVSFGLNPSMPANSLMLRDKSRQVRTSAETFAHLNECQVGGYLFNQHR